MTVLVVRGPAGPLRGRLAVPGDKSISHRAALCAALAEGTSRIEGFLDAETCRATLRALSGLGVAFERPRPDLLWVHGRGAAGLVEPARPLDCGGSGTTLRLLLGLLAGQPFASFLVGSDQLQRRPMDRVVEPLRRMGALVVGRGGGRLAPLALAGSRAAPLRGAAHVLPVASAQVKSALLLAGLFAEGPTRVREPAPSRDHSERLLLALGAPLRVEPGGSASGGGALEPPTLVVERLARPFAPFELEVPGDASSAAFLLVAAALVPGSEVLIESLGTNPTRIAFLELLSTMGARVERLGERVRGGEPRAEVLVAHQGPLGATRCGGAAVPALIDELPVLAVAFSQAAGESGVEDAAELRVKESDRIATTVAELSRLGAALEARPAGFVARGPARLRGAEVDARGDHRLAMALAVAGLVAEGETRVRGAEVLGESYPGFADALRALGADVELR